ncbi:MAG: YtxH domain-containing protein [Candidatus Saccharimonadales bacterium]
MNKEVRLLTFTVLAAGIGYAAGMLFAPKSGHETRADIRRRMLEMRHRSQEKFIEGKDKARTILRQMGDKAKEAGKWSEKTLDETARRI